ncbi:hypothetical protein P5V15_010216 [Pogonomyrmex californicus]
MRNPFVNITFGYSDEIRLQQQDLYTLPFLYVKGKLTKNRVVDGSDVVLGNIFVAYMFDEIRYELDGVEIDRNRNMGITSTLKHYVTTSSDRSVILRNAGWDTRTMRMDIKRDSFVYLSTHFGILQGLQIHNNQRFTS